MFKLALAFATLLTPLAALAQDAGYGNFYSEELSARTLPDEAWQCINKSQDFDSCLYCDKSCMDLPTDDKRRDCSLRVWCWCTNKFNPKQLPAHCKKLGIPKPVSVIKDF